MNATVLMRLIILPLNRCYRELSQTTIQSIIRPPQADLLMWGMCYYGGEGTQSRVDIVVGGIGNVVGRGDGGNTEG